MIGGMTTPPPAQVQPRRATKADVAALVHLRSLMFSAMGVDVGGQDAAWRLAATRWFLEQLDRPQEFAGFVVEHPVDGVVCAALGSCDARAPSPGNVTARHGHVFNISTEPAHRRRGYAQACLTALLTWFRKDIGVRVIDLAATPDGARLYELAGFRERPVPSMRLLIQQPPPA
jgi:ribosomal protein S18 acetylase RimI-like enzyme